MDMTSEINGLSTYVIHQETCINCKSIMNITEIDPNYSGLLATYPDDKYCTISCLTEQPIYLNELKK